MYGYWLFVSLKNLSIFMTLFCYLFIRYFVNDKLIVEFYHVIDNKRKRFSYYYNFWLWIVISRHIKNLDDSLEIIFRDVEGF